MDCFSYLQVDIKSQLSLSSNLNSFDHKLIILSHTLFSGSLALHVRTICESKSGFVRCPHKELISIHSVLYGRLEVAPCHTPAIYSTTCASSLAPAIVRRRCQGQNACYLYASNHFFGDPCVRTDKYLQVVYRCIRS